MVRTPIRVLGYIVAAALLGVVVGVVRDGSLGGGLPLGFAVSLGVAVGLVGVALLKHLVADG